MMRLGLCGGHRTGKTTLAEALARRLALPFVKTSTSLVFAAHGLNPAQPLDFVTRLWIQQRILEAAEEIWQAAPAAFISDRTPVDMMAYTLADIQGSTVVPFAELENYLERCFASTNRFFSHLVMLQPGIPLVAETGKAALNPAYLEHLNSLIWGLCRDERLFRPVMRIQRATLDLEERIGTVLEFVSKYSIES